MGEKQVTTMVLKVDLECYKCYKKIKKVLCKFPQIQDQVYDEKQNTVTIKVVCCSPEKIKQKIICKAGDTLKSIEIKVPEKPPKESPKPNEPGKKPEKPKDQEKPKESEKPKEAEKPKESEKPKDAEKPKPASPPPAPLVMVPCVPGYPPPLPAIPRRTCCTDCYEGRSGGPCFYGCVPPGPPLCYQYDGYCGRPVYDSYGGGRAYYTSRCDYFSEENTGACSIMKVCPPLRWWVFRSDL